MAKKVSSSSASLFLAIKVTEAVILDFGGSVGTRLGLTQLKIEG